MNEKQSEITTADLAYGKSTEEMSGSNASLPGLLPDNDVSSFSNRWGSIQTHFVDEPKASVQEADSLVAEVIQKLATRFADERQKLERQWSNGGEASTEDLRQALQHYRSFFQRLLAA